MSEKVLKKIPEQIIKDIKSHSHVVLFTHSHPDGDAIGSMLGFASLLEAMGKEVFCMMEEPVSYLYEFLPDTDKIHTSFDEYLTFMQSAGEDVLSVALDCGDANRLGKLKDDALDYEPFWVIDHHQSHRNFGTGRWVETTCSSTGEMVYELGEQLGAELSYNGAYNLYVAICTDTGSFRYESTGTRTMEIAGQLLKKGVKPHEVGSNLYDNFTKERLHLMGLALGSIELLAEDRVAFMTVTQKMLQESGATLEDLEGFIDLPRSLQCVKVAALFKEALGGMVSVSMRAKGECDVAKVANLFGGGGHKNAAGFRGRGKTIGQVKKEVHSVLKNLVVDV